MKWHRIRWYFLLTAILIAGGVVLVYLHLRPISVQIARSEADMPVQVFGLGTVEAHILSRIGFEVSGTLVELHADHGDHVTSGTLLARLHSREQEAHVAQADASIAQTEAAIHQATANAEHARITFEQKKQANDRRQTMLRRGNVSIETAEDAQAAVDLAASDVTQASSAVEVARANLQQSRATATLEAARLAKYALYAPYDAVVIARQRELGVVLAPGEPIFTLIDSATVWVLAYVDEADAGGLRIGQPVAIRLRSLPGQTFPGEVVRIDLESDRVSEERRVYVTFTDCPQDIHLGEQAEALITVARLDRALLVPQTAVTGYQEQGGTVWTVEDGHLAQREVAFGHRTLDGRLEIASGIPADTAVVTRLDSGLRIGRRATVEGDQPR